MKVQRLASMVEIWTGAIVSVIKSVAILLYIERSLEPSSTQGGGLIKVVRQTSTPP